MSAMPNTNPLTAWKALKEGSERFVAGKPMHPSQSIEHRASLAAAQKPTAVVFGCADSRVAAEIIFDQGLGDMFVVRTAGHVIDSAVLGSIEYAVLVLNVPLIVVLGHDSCGAVGATLAALDEGAVPPGYVRDVVERVTPSILLGRRDGLERVDEFEARHVTETGKQLLSRSTAIAEAVRRHRPDVVLTGNFRDTWGGANLNQADHIAVGKAVLDAVRDAGNRWVFTEQLVEGGGSLEKWGGVGEVWAFGSPQATHAVDTAATFDAGGASLEAHRAYIDGLGWEHFDPREFLEGMARATGQRLGCAFAAPFEVFPMGWGE